MKDENKLTNKLVLKSNMESVGDIECGKLLVSLQGAAKSSQPSQDDNDLFFIF